jgi:amino acid adenylation domain-containing protein
MSEGFVLPVSFAQQRLWFLAAMQPESTAYNLSGGFVLRGALLREVLARSLAEVVRRHESLRTTFTVRDGQPVQVVTLSGLRALPGIDLRALPAPSRGAEVGRLLNTQARRLFDLARGPLVRCALVELAADEKVLLYGMHHIITDGWSEAVLAREVAQLYRAFAAGEPSPLPELPIQYGDYAQWQLEWLQGEVLAELLAYWRAQLAGAPAMLELPADLPRPAAPASRGAVVEIAVPDDVAAALGQLGRRQGCTLFHVLLAAFGVLLARWSGQDDVVIGSPVVNRDQVELEGLIGLFVDMVPLRIDLAGEPAFEQLLPRVREIVHAAHEHKALPFEKLITELRIERRANRNPLFQVVFNFETQGEEPAAFGGLSLASLKPAAVTAKFDLALGVVERRGGPLRLMAVFEYASELFAAATIRRLSACFATLLAGIAEDARRRVFELPLTSAAELAQMAGLAAAAAGAVVRPDCLHEVFAAQARRAPGAVAVVHEGERLTYGDLDRRAERLARRLRPLLGGREPRVAIYLERSAGLVVAMVAALKAGAAYVPLDPAYPRERIELLLRDSGAPVVVTEASLAGSLPAYQGEVLDLEGAGGGEGERGAAGVPSGQASSAALAASPAYVIYTSGSTGTPKGVVVSHWNVVRLFAATREWFRFDAGDVWTLFHSCAFDFSVWEVWGALLHGGRLVVVPYWVSRTPEAFRELLRRERVTVLNQTPSAFYQLARLEQAGGEPHRLDFLRWVIFGGEALEPAKLAAWLARYGESSPRLINMYGITETTVHVTFRPLSRADLQPAAASPIGVPLPDLRVHLLDRRGQPVPHGFPGEICVAGDGLALGYLGRPDLTALRFVPDPFGATAGGRLYRSGDLGRRRPGTASEELEYLGRADRQVKIRGFRIEPGEIEATLVAHPGLANAAVLARPAGEGPPQLIAYVVAAPGAAPPPAAGELREFLAAKLPAYMIPARFLTLAALPLTPHGKLDRQALPEPSSERSELAEAWEPPRTPVEEILAAIWAKVLGADRVGIHDNFFALGGDSIRSLQVLTAARERGITLTLLQLFQHQTIAALARELSLGGDGALADLRCEPFSLIDEEDRRQLPDDVEDAYPLARLQEGMLYHMAMQPEDAPYHNVDSWLLAARFAPDLFRTAVQEVVARHPVLRTSFDLTSYSQPLQLVHRRAVLPVAIEDLRQLPVTDQRARIAELMVGEKRRIFDFAVAPQLRFHVHLLGEDRFRFTLIENHAVFDGWSLHATLTEIFSRYSALLQGAPMPAAPPLALTFRDFVHLERLTLESETARQHWRRQLEGHALTALPRWPAGDAGPGPRHRELEVPVPDEVSAGLLRLARAAAVPIKSVLLAAHMRVLGLLSGRRDVTTGAVFNGRPEQPEGEEVRGLFLNSLPLRLGLPGGSWRGLVSEAFAAELALLPFRRFPTNALLRETGGVPLFEVLFNFVNFHVVENLLTVGELEVLEFQGFEGTGYPLHVTFSPRVRLTLEYDATVLPRAEVGWIGGLYSRTLAAMSADPEGSYDAPQLLAPSERQEVAAPLPAELPSGLAALPARDRERLPADVEDAYPITLLQAGMLYELAASPEDPPHHEVASWRLRLRFSAAALREAARRVSARHPLLRTSFDLGASEPLQRVHARAEPPLAVADLRGLSAASQDRQVAAWLAAFRRLPFAPATAPHLALHVCVLGPQEIQLTVTHGHAILDDRSRQAIVTELLGLHSALLRGEVPPAEAPAAASYRDFVALERQALAAAAAQGFWDELLAGAPFTGLPAWPDWPLLGEAPRVRVMPLALPLALGDELQELGRRAAAPVASILLTAHVKALALAAAEGEVVTGLVADGRLEAAGGGEVRGQFLNVLPLRLALVPGSWLDLVGAVERATRGILPHQRFPHAALQRRRPDQPLFETTFRFIPFDPAHDLADDLVRAGELSIAGFSRSGDGRFKLAVAFSRRSRGDGLRCELAYDSHRLPVRQAAAYGELLLRVLAAMTADPGAPHQALSPLSEPERQQQLIECNDTAAAVPNAARLAPAAESISELFEWQAALRPDAPAVAGQGVVLRYGELAARSSRLARRLRRLGVGPEVRVALCVERTPDMVVALLAILRAGGAYVPLDPAHPPARLALVLEDSAPAVLVTEGRWLERLRSAAPGGEAAAGRAEGPQVVCLDRPEDWGEVADAEELPPRPAVPPEGMAYVIYTSGSTGRPKGVELPHRALVNFLSAMAERTGIGPGDVVPALTTLTFDIAGLEIYLPLAVGARVEVLDREEAADGSRLAARLAAAGVTLMQATPAGWRLLLESGWEGQPGLKGLCGGEALPRDLAAALLARGVELWNVYGPTETAVWSTAGPVPGATRAGGGSGGTITAGPAAKAGGGPSGAIDLGRPLANTRLYVVDRRLEPVAAGGAGELLIGGAGVARGYWRQPELTAERFVPDAWSTVPGGRLYRTGDLVRRRRTGEIDFLGRIDHQVKVRGHRIEPAEIEAALARHPGVRESVVVARRDAGDIRLVAYVALEPDAATTGDELRRSLGDTLPPYMVPAAVVTLTALPRTANGKLDRQALPAPAMSLAEREHKPPRTPMQLQLVHLWEEILAVRPIGIGDDFFDVGGDSMLAVRLVAQIRKRLGRNLPISTLVTARTVEDLAGLLEQKTEGRRRHLVAIQPRGTKPAVYWMHPGHGNIVCYLDLARHLGTDQPTYGLQALDMDDGVDPFAGIEAMAARYVAEIRQHQPHGPYLIGGWSLGGVIAYEVAQQLTLAGEEVAALLLLDCSLPVIASSLLAISPSLMRSYLLIDHVRDAAAAAGKEPLPLTPYDIDGMTMDAQLDLLVGELQQRDAMPLGVDKDMLRRYFEIRLARIDAQNRYVPRPYPGRITLIKTTALNLGITLREMRQMYADAMRNHPTYGWGDLTPEPVEVRTVPGHHESMVREPHVRVLAEEVRASLAAVEERRRSRAVPAPGEAPVELTSSQRGTAHEMDSAATGGLRP